MQFIGLFLSAIVVEGIISCSKLVFIDKSQTTRLRVVCDLPPSGRYNRYLSDILLELLV